MLISPVPLTPLLERLRDALEVGSGERICHRSLAHLLQVGHPDLILSVLVCLSLRKSTNRIVFVSQFVSEIVLFVKALLNPKGVSTVHPDAKGALFHPVVHLAEQNLPVPLRCHVLLVELLHRPETLLHQPNVKSFLELFAAALVALTEPLAVDSLLVEIECLAEEPLSHLSEEQF